MDNKNVSDKKTARHIAFKIGQPQLNHVEGRPISIESSQLPNNPTQMREVTTAKSPYHPYRRDSVHPYLVPMNQKNHEPPVSQLSHVQEDVFQDEISGFDFQAFLLIPCFELTIGIFCPKSKETVTLAS